MERRVRPRWLTGAADGGIFAFGIVMAVIGAVLPRLSIHLAQAGNLFLSMTVTMLLTQLLLGPAMDRFGKKLPLAAGAFIVALALALLARQPGYAGLVAAVALLGVGGGALNGGTNTLVADLHADPRRKSSALNLLGVYFGFGALFLPFVIGSLLERVGLAIILGAAAALTAAVGFLFLALAFPKPRHAAGLKLDEATRLARNPLVLLFGCLLFFESGNEFVIGGYTTTYLTRELGVSFQAASYLLAAYWGSMMLMRVLASRLLLRVGGPALVLASAAAAALGITVLLASSSPGAAGAGVILVGLSFASIYPTVLGLAGARFEEYSGTVFGILFAMGLAGGMAMPWAVGQIGQRTGLRTGLALTAAGAVMTFALQAVIVRRLPSDARA